MFLLLDALKVMNTFLFEIKIIKIFYPNKIDLAVVFLIDVLEWWDSASLVSD
jgi:hypothetical protein